MQSTSKFWGLQQTNTFENCWTKDKLLLHSNACQQFAQNLTSPAWTNVFREEIEVERTLVDTTSVPKFCQSANISDNKGEKMLNIHWQNCSIKLEWFVCKNDTSTVENTYHMEVATDANYGAIVGGSVGAVIVLLIGVTVILCKVR
ncbi:uncharacterized protein LOC127699932 [Mytilus californianus]|uniref:uncharacterized protein LOC127699932 n=1 Tax=Mytilus californianus TaxID=6549 RepID=UPI002245A5A6|nr:uncharacterized protein LOC127699932 [Mytilus californianus]